MSGWPSSFFKPARRTASICCVCIAIVGDCPQAGQAPLSPSRTLLDKYCVTCHNDKRQTAGLMLDRMNIEDVSTSAAAWEKVVRKLRSGTMPPVGMPPT